MGMRAARRVAFACVITTAAAIAGGSSVASAHSTRPVRASGAHLLARRHRTRATATATGPLPHLQYYGGAVMSHVKVYAVQWGGEGAFFPELTSTSAPNVGSYFGEVTGGKYFSWLSEYNTTLNSVGGAPGTNQVIGAGSFAGVVTVEPSADANADVVDDSVIQAELAAQIDAGHLPAPDADTLYVLWFRQGQVITLGPNDRSDTTFCAYHNTIASNVANTAVNVRYAVMPYEDNGGCGTDANLWNNAEMIASHELVESVTDPDVGLANDFAPPLGWYDPQGSDGEIGDICNQDAGAIQGTDGFRYSVQREWSNRHNDCIVSSPHTISVGDASLLEGNAGTRILQIPVTLSEVPSANVTARATVTGISATGGTHPAPGVDFGDKAGVLQTLKFRAGATTAFLSVPVYGDTAAEGDETFDVALSNPSVGYTIARAHGTGTIIDDDTPSGITLGIGDATVSAGSSGLHSVRLVVTLSSPAASNITIAYSAGLASGTLTIPRKATARVLQFSVNPSYTPDIRTFTVTLHDPTGGPVTLVRPAGTGTIIP